MLILAVAVGVVLYRYFKNWQSVRVPVERAQCLDAAVNTLPQWALQNGVALETIDDPAAPKGCIVDLAMGRVLWNQTKIENGMSNERYSVPCIPRSGSGRYELTKAGAGCTIKQDDSAARVHRDHCYALARPLGNDAMQTELSVVNNPGFTQGCSDGIGDGTVYYNNSEDTPYHPSRPRVCVGGDGGAFLGEGVCTPGATFKPASDEVEKNDCLGAAVGGLPPSIT